LCLPIDDSNTGRKPYRKSALGFKLSGYTFQNKGVLCVYKLFRRKQLFLFVAFLAAVLFFTIEIGVHSGHILASVIYTNAEHSPNEGAVQVPVIMYHSILKSRKGSFIVSPAQLEEDLQYIQKEGFHTVTIGDLIDYVHHDVPLPEKPIVITFDDGFLNNITYAVPLLEAYHMKAVISVVGSYTETSTQSGDRNPNYSYLNWEDVRSLILSDTIEIQNHTYDLHKKSGGRNGAAKIKGETVEHYRQVLMEDLEKFEEEMEAHTGSRTAAFTYPFGQLSDVSEDIIKEAGYLASLSCREKIRTITKNPKSLYQIGRFNRPASLSTAQFFGKVLKEYGK